MKIGRAVALWALLSCQVALGAYDSLDWVPVGSLNLQPDGATIYAVLVTNGNTYVGGSFTNIGGVNANGVARFNGTNWVAMGSGVEDRGYDSGGDTWRDYCGGVVFALVADASGNIYAGGGFKRAGGVTAHNIAKWNGSSWSSLPGQGFPYTFERWQPLIGQAVYCLLMQGTDLYVGGSLFSAGGTVAATNIVRLVNGNTWQAVGSGLGRYFQGYNFTAVRTLAAYGNSIIAGGGFESNGARVACRRLAYWTPGSPATDWQTSSGGADGMVYSLLVAGNDLIVGGAFTNVGSAPVVVNRIARYNGTLTQWQAFGAGMDGQVSALARDASGRIYAGGPFTNADGLVVNGVAQWTGSFWLPMGTGVSNTLVNVMTVDPWGRVLVAGGFGKAGGVPARGLATFDRYWKSACLPPNCGAKVNVILPDPENNAVYVGGDFSSIGGTPANSIAKWNGSSWEALGDGMQIVTSAGTTQGVVNAIVFDNRGKMLVGGKFNRAGGKTSHAMAMWYHDKWIPVENTLGPTWDGSEYATSTVYTLTWFPRANYFYVGGDLPCTFINDLAVYVPADNTFHYMMCEWFDNTLYFGFPHNLTGPIRAAGVSPSDGMLYLGGEFNQLSTFYGTNGYAPYWEMLNLLACNLEAPWGSGFWSTLYPMCGDRIPDGIYAITFDAQSNLIFGSKGGPGIGKADRVGRIEYYETANLGTLTLKTTNWPYEYSSWDPLGGGVSCPGGTAAVKALMYDAAGVLFVGGSFTYAGSNSAARVARWNGSEWLRVGTNTTSKDVRALAFDPWGHLLVGGDFGYGWNASDSSNAQNWSDGLVMAVELGPKLDAVGTNGAVIVSGERASVEKGTDFEDVMPIGSSLTRTFSLMNLGTLDLAITNASFSGTGAANFFASGVPSRINCNAISNFTIRFTPPAAPGVYTAALVLRSTAGADCVINVRGSAGCRYIKTSQNTDLGTITPDGNVPVYVGSNQTFTMISTNNRLPYATVDGTNRGILYTYTYTNVTHNLHTLHVDFNIDTVVSSVVVTQRSLVSRDKYVDINYTLADADNSPNRITVAISTNGGDSYDIVPSSCSGDIGSGVMPGSKHIVWLAHQDWDGQYCADALVRITATDDNGDAEGDAGPLLLDTEYGVRPRVKDIRGLDKLDLLNHKDFFNKDTSATFLDDIRLLYGVGGSFDVPMLATVDWRGTTEGNVEWYVNGQKTRTGTASAEQTFSVSDDFGEGGTLEVQAVPGDAQRSVMAKANFEVVAPPKLWTRYTAAAPYGGRKTYTYLNPNLSFSQKSEEKVPEKTPQGKDMPGGGQNKFEAPFTLNISGEVDLEGSGNLGASMSKSWEVKGINITPSVSGGVDFEYAYEDADWMYSGYFSVAVDVSKETEPRYITFEPPLYGKLGAHISVGGTVHFDEHFDPEWGESEIEITPGFWATAGFGIADLANVEGLVGLDLPNKFQISPFAYELSLDLRAELSANLLFWSWTIWSENWPFVIYRTGYSGSSVNSAMSTLSANIADMKPQQFKLMSRDYLRARGGARPFENRLVLRDGTEVPPPPGGAGSGLQASPGELFVQADSFPFSEPALDVAGASRMLLWVDDAGTNRIAQNANALNWSTWTGSTWTNRGLIWDDGTGDSKPQLKLLSNGKAIAAWQNSGYVLSSTSGLAEALSGLEIAVARYNGTNWTAFNLTTNNVMDRAPQLSVAGNGTALLTWQQNAGTLNPSSLIMNQVDSLYYSYFNGTNWSAARPAALNVGLVLGATVAWNGKAGHLFVALDADRDIRTDADQEIYRVTYSNGVWGALTRCTSNNVQDTRPQAVFDSSGNYLMTAWYQDGAVYSSWDTSLGYPMLVGVMPKTSSAQDFRLVTSSGADMAMVWTDSIEPPFFRNPCLFVYDRSYGHWSKPVPLLSDSALERSFSGKLTTGGSIVLAYNKVETHLNDDNIVTNVGPVTALATLEYTFGRDGAIFARDIVLDSATLTPGSNVTGSATFRNVGELDMNNMWGEVYLGDPDAGGIQIARTRFDDGGGQWKAGSSNAVYFSWTVPSNGVEQSIYAKLFVGSADRDSSNDEAFISPMRPDYEVLRFSEEKISANERLLHLAVRNAGLIMAPTNSLVLRLDSTNGQVLATLPFGPLAMGESYTNEYLWDMSGMTFTTAFVRLVAVVDAGGAVQEASERNNVRYRRVSSNVDTDNDGLLDGEEARYGTDPAMADTDGDGLRDYDEIFVYNSNPRDRDSDQDGLSDAAEVARSTELRNPDSDGDGFSDGVEVAKGTNPLDKNSYPTGMLTLTVRGQPAQFGIARPAGYGTNYYDSGSVVTSRVDRYVSISRGIREACTGWTGNGSVPLSGSGTQVVFTISNASTATWNFVQQYELSLDTLSDGTTNGAPGLVTGASSAWYNAGASITVTAAPLAAYSFAGWSGDLPVAMTNNNPLTLTISNACSLFARFVRRQVTLQVVSARGTPTPAVGTQTYPYGEIVNPTVNSPIIVDGIMYECTGWTMTDNEPSSGTGTLFTTTLMDDAVLTWLWRTNALLTVSCGAGGTVSGSASGWYPLDAGISLTANPQPNWRLVQWSGDVPPAFMTTNPLTLAMSQSRSITATFTNPAVQVIGAGSPVNGGNVSGGGTYRAGTNIVLTATPFTNWLFGGWTDGETNRVRTIVVPMTSITYTATFVPLMSTVSVLASPADGGAVTGGGSYQAGSSVPLTATPFANWTFAGWTDGNTNRTRSIVVPQTNITFTASFVRISPAFWYVSAGGSDAAAGTNWATAKQTLQAAADLTRDGDTILVNNGTYASGGRPAGGGSLTNRLAVTNAVTVRSANGAGVTTIAGGSGVRGVYLGAGSVLVGFTIVNGATLMAGPADDRNGGGVWAAGSVVISNSTIAANTANALGGGVYGGSRLMNCQVCSNSAAQGGGVWVADSTLVSNAAIFANTASGAGGGVYGGTLINCQVYSNSAAQGGGVRVADSTLLSNLVVFANTASGAGGGIYGGSLLNCQVWSNSAAQGGGAYVAMSAFVSNSIVFANTASGTGGGIYGGGYLVNCQIYSNSAAHGGGAYVATTAFLSNVIVFANTASGTGGGIYGGSSLLNCRIYGNAGAQGGGACVAASAFISNALVFANTASGAGGGICGGSRLVNCQIYSNAAGQGGGAWVAGSTVISNSTIAANSATGAGGGVYGGGLFNCPVYSNAAAQGGGVYGGSLANCPVLGNAATAQGGGAFLSSLANCLVSENTATQGGGAYASALINCTVSANAANEGGGAYASTGRNTIVYFNTAATASNVVAGSYNYSCVAPLPAGTGNTASDPIFFRASHGDYRLGTVSPCMNSGDNAAVVGSTDLQGTNRILSGTVDMGAYEGGLLITKPEASYPGAEVLFDGVDDYLAAGHSSSVSFGGDFTIEAWVRVPDFSATREIVTKQPTYSPNSLPGNFEFRIEQTTGRLAFGFEYGEYSGAYAFWSSVAAIPAGQYTHVAVVVRAGSSVQFFINGVPDILRRTDWYRPVPNTSPVRIGARADGFFFKGEMDEVRLWSVARSSTEIAENYRRRLDGNEAGLGAYWRMDEGLGATVADSSGNGNTAALQNGAYFVRSDARINRASAPSTNAVVVSLSGYRNLFPANELFAKIDSLPALGSLLQYGSLNAITSTPATVTDSGRRVLYVPPAGVEAVDSFVYRANDGDYDSLNTATVLVDIATATHVPFASYPGASLRFNGSSSYVTVPDSGWLDLNAALTLEAWVKINNYDQWNPVIAKQTGSDPGNYEFRIDQGSGRLTFGFKGKNCPELRFYSTQGSVPTGEWAHVAVTYSKDVGVSLYINGLPDSGGDNFGDPWCFEAKANNYALLIGGRADGLRFAGEMDEVRVWNRMLGETEIVRGMRQHLLGSENGLAAYWSLDDSVGSDVADVTGHGNGGTIMNGAQFILSSAPIDLVYAPTTNDVTILLGGYKTNSAPTNLAPTILSLPDQGTLRQYGTLDAITNVPAQVTDSQRRVLYSPPLANATYPFTYRVSDGVSTSPNVAAVRIRVATVAVDRYVNWSNVAPVEPYSTWDTAATNIQQAIDAADDGDIIHVAPGVYGAGGGRRMPGFMLPNRVYVGRPVTLRSTTGPESTIIWGDGMRAVYLGRNARMDGFTIAGGSVLSGEMILWKDLTAGGVYNEDSAVLTNCIISGNSGQYGAGASYGTLYNCRLTNNISVETGGGAYRATLHRCYLSRNGATRYGGGAEECTLYNCLIVGNHADRDGAGAWGGTLYNCTVVSNDAWGVGGGVYHATLINSICIFNTAPNHQDSSFAYSCTTPDPGGTGNITNDPMFKSMATGDFNLLDGSPCLNVGDTASATNLSSDFAGNPRVQAGIVEMGAFESPAVPIVVVANPSQGGSVAGSGSYTPGVSHVITATPTPLWDFVNWSHGSVDPVTTITVPATGTTYTANFVRPHIVWYVAPSGSDSAVGTNWAAAKKTIQAAIDAATTGDVVVVSNGVYNAGGKTMYGAGTRAAIDKPIAVHSLNGAAVTIIQGNGARSAALCAGASLDGFTLSGGVANTGGNVCSDPAGVVSNCVITGGVADNGGGIFGGIARRCVISGNRTWRQGGGADSALLESCVIWGNVNSSVCEGTGGGAVYSVLKNCVVAYNSRLDPECRENGCGGVFQCSNYNTIVYFNTTDYGAANYDQSWFDHSCTFPAAGGTGNITNDPQFVNGPAGSLWLAPGSPCRNAGDNANAAPDTDVVNMPRIIEGIVDMGAYEVQTQALITVQASPSQGGTVSGGGYYTVGATAVVSATVNPGWTLASWSDGETAAVRRVVVPGSNIAFTANFVIPVNVSGLAVPAGGTFLGEGVHVSGSTNQLTAVATAPWIFLKWSWGDTNNTITFVVPYSDVVYRAHFALVTPSVGPLAGGNLVTVTNGYFGAITNVLLGSTPVSIQSSGSNWVQFLSPAMAATGTYDIVIQTADNGTTRIARAYSVNPAGWIHGPPMARPTHGNLNAGAAYTIALRADGSALTWGGCEGGYNFGQLNVPPPNESFVDVGAGWAFSTYVRSNGSISAVGQNTLGECNVPSPNEDFVEVDSGDDHSVALKSDGTVVCWGYNSRGQCNVPAPNEGFVAVAAGDNHSLGLKTNGVVVAWGYNDSGQCNVSANNSNIIAVAANGRSSFGLKSDGTVVAWGFMGVPSPNSNFVAIAAQRYHAAAIRADGSVVCWGDNSYGQCNVPAPNQGFVEVCCGTWHTVGLKEDGTLVAWGQNSYGQLNLPSPNQDFGINTAAIDPCSGAVTGGYEVVIYGSNLGDGTDVTSVTLAGIPVAQIVNQSATQIVVIAGVAPDAMTGDVRVVSTSYGVAVRSNGFTYACQNPQAITFPAIADQVATNRLALSATASSGLTVSFAVASGPAVIGGGVNLTFTGAGVVQIAASQPGNPKWLAAEDATCSFTVYPAPMSIALSGLAQSYDGTPRVVSCTTDPAGVPVSVLYDGLTNAPAAVGSYDVLALSADPRYDGMATGTLVVTKANASVYLSALSQYYNGSVRGVAATTMPAGLTVEFAYEGGVPPIDPGTYGVTGTVVDAGYQGSATGTLTILEAPQSIAFGGISTQLTTYVTPLNATAGSGLPVSFEVVSGPGALGLPTSPSTLTYTGPGSVVVRASQDGDEQWEAAADVTRTIVVVKATASLTLRSLLQAYNGTPRAIGVSTVPTGLAVNVTYDGSPTPPINPGIYAVTGIVNDAMYQGETVGLLTISRASGSVYLSDLVHMYDGTPKSASVTTMPAGLSVIVTYNGSVEAPSNSGSYAVEAALDDTNYNGSATGTLVIAASSQSITFPSIPTQIVTNVTMLAATASSGLPVSYDIWPGPAYQVDSNALAYSDRGWVVVVARQPGEGNWAPAPEVTNTFRALGVFTVNVASAYGTVAPGPGLHAFVEESIVTNRCVSGSPTTQGATQYVVTGWTLFDHDPATGSGPQMVMTVTNDAMLVWNWVTNYWLSASAGLHGSVAPTGTWVQAGWTTTVTALPDQYCAFDQWSGDLTGQSNPLVFVMSQPLAIHADFHVVYMLLTVVPLSNGGTVAPTGTTAVLPATPVGIAAQPTAPNRFMRWFQIGGGTVADSAAPTTTVTLVSNSIVTAYFLQDVTTNVSANVVKWRTNYMTGTLFADIQICNTNAQGCRLTSPFWYCAASNQQCYLRRPSGREPTTGYPYVDITTQVLAQLTNSLLQPGECVNVTNVEFYSRYLLPITNVTWALWSVRLPSASEMDTDGDGIPDAWEQQFPSAVDWLNPLDWGSDADADGFSSREEWIAGTDPGNGSSLVLITGVRGGGAAGHVVQWPSVAGRVYDIAGATRLTGDFTVLQTGMSATPPLNSYTDTVFATETAVFYRIDVHRP